MFAVLFSLFTLFTPVQAPNCAHVSDDRVIGIDLTLANGESMTFFASPRFFEALQTQGDVKVSLFNGCTVSDPDWGEDGERNEVFDYLTGWEIGATSEVKARLLALGMAQ